MRIYMLATEGKITDYFAEPIDAIIYILDNDIIDHITTSEEEDKRTLYVYGMEHSYVIQEIKVIGKGCV